MLNALDITNHSAYTYHDQISKKFTSLCVPLFNNLNIDTFGYMRTFTDGRYLSLVNNPDYIKYYLENIVDLGTIFDPVIKKAEKNSFYYFSWPQNINDVNKVKDSIFSTLWNFNIWNGFSIYKRNDDDSVESWNFATTTDKHKMNSFFLNNIPLLEHFIFYFQEKAAEIIDCSNIGKLAIFKNQARHVNLSSDELNFMKINTFLEETQIDKFLIHSKNRNIYLTKVEIKTLTELCYGKTVKEIAVIRNVSTRTIESCINTIKIKTNLYSKSQLCTLLSPQELIALNPIKS